MHVTKLLMNYKICGSEQVSNTEKSIRIYTELKVLFYQIHYTELNVLFNQIHNINRQMIFYGIDHLCMDR